MGFPNFSEPHRKKQMVPVKIARGRGRAGRIEGTRAVKVPLKIGTGIHPRTIKKRACPKGQALFLAEKEGFEPSRRFPDLLP